jgi:pimeloyl-ACP methyl ester carboxylesterase
MPHVMKIVRFLLLGGGLVLALPLSLAVGLVVWVIAVPPVADTSEFHPFRSPGAKARFLALYEAMERDWPVESELETVGTSHGRTFVRITGPDSAPPLVLLHGAGGSSLHWGPNVGALSQRFRTYAVDVIDDFGRSVYARPIESADEYVRWLDELFDALELGDQVNLMGLSYGGWIASQYVLRHPERVGKVVLLAPAETVLPLDDAWIWRTLSTVLPHRYFTERLLYWLMEDLAQASDSGRELLNQWTDLGFAAVASYKPKGLVPPSVLTDEQWRSITVPLLYLVGENEKIYPADRAVERLAAVAPHVQAEIIPGAGHDLSVVQAELVNRKVLEFLAP